jgi:Protein of unknown function (DUF3352)
MVAMQEPISGDLTPFHPKPQRRRLWWLFVAPIAVFATVAGGYIAMTPQVSKLSGMNLLPANTTMAAQVAIDRSDWLRLKDLGTPASRAILERELAKWSQETLGDTNLFKSIPPWLGKEIYWARLATGDNLALLSIRNTLPAQPGSERQYQGVTIWETAKESRAVIASKDEKFLAIGSKAAIEQAIAAQKGQNLATAPVYAQMNKAITGGDSIAQIYVNLPQAMGSKSTAKLTSQAMLMNISTKDQVLAAKGVVWSNKKLVPSKHSPGFAAQVPASTMLLLSGSSLGKLWAEYLPLAANNPAAPIQPQALQDNLKSSTGLDLNTNILSWGSGDFAVAIVPQTLVAQTQIESGSVGGALLLLSRSTDPAATDQTMSSLDKTMADRYKFKVDKTNLKNLSIVRWSAALGGTQATHGWLPNQVAFLTLGVPIAEQFLPNPDKSLENHSDFRKVISGEISPIDTQVYVDVNKMATSGNLPLQKFPEDTQTILQAINSIGLVSNAVSDQANRFDLAIYLKSVAK